MLLVIIDDHPLFREGVMNTLAKESDVTIIGEGASVEDAVCLAATLRPDILVLDLDIPGGGLSAIQRIIAAAPLTRIVVLTFADSEEKLVAALNGGALSYVLKGVTGRELARIIRDAHAGHGYVPPELAASVLTARNGSRTSHRVNVLDQLTERERQVLTMVGGGATNVEIARALSLAETTVKNIMTVVMQKLQVRNRVEAAILANRASQASLQRSS